MRELLNLIKDPKNKAIAALAVALIIATAMNFRDKAVKEVQTEVSKELKVIVEDDRKDEIDFTKATKDIEANEEQIKALWISIQALSDKFSEHATQRKH